ncbi:MAG: SUMF1/EgtB/PvdO family nonheme iron enzyme [Myxococcales bacterium]|nr:SUMF1/EgtB/PvdO family nonheme iron enzyme [Myxococcales bacterium]
MRALRRAHVVQALGVLAAAAACRTAATTSPAEPSPRPPASADARDATPPPERPTSVQNAPIEDAGAGDAAPVEDPMAGHASTKDELRALFSIKELGPKERAVVLPESFLSQILGADDPRHVSQGNRAIAEHTISRAACLRGLAGVEIQTAEQRAACGGAENMVPVHFKDKAATFCVDVFEFPNKACELPFVWVPPTYAKKLCELQGKRLCAQWEWQLACRGDPAGGPDRRYAYGDKLDLTACHTNKPHRKPCNTLAADKAWATCTTDTEPAGSFPQCRSRFGVFDLHGNVAEIMMRRDETGAVVSQLKGSAWFYTEVAHEPGAPPKPGSFVETYPDTCNFDPRWHVESIDTAWHVNYHLGFRCCKSVP